MDVDTLISRVEAITGYVFRNKLLCAEALQMKEPNCPLRVAGVIHLFNKNRDLELVGDTILDVVFVKMWYEACNYNGDRHSLAAWTQMRNDLVSNKMLAKRGVSLGLDNLIIKNLGMRFPSPDMVANTLEAVIGAICMDVGDSSFKAVRDALEHMGFFEHPLLAGSSNIHFITTGLATAPPA